MMPPMEIEFIGPMIMFEKIPFDEMDTVALNDVVICPAYFKSLLNKMAVIAMTDSVGVIEPKDITFAINSAAANRLGRTAEMANYLRMSPWASRFDRSEALGKTLLPQSIYGFSFVIDELLGDCDIQLRSDCKGE